MYKFRISSFAYVLSDRSTLAMLSGLDLMEQ